MNEFEVKLLSSASRDLDGLFDYIESEAGLPKAVKFIERILKHCATLKTFPNRGTLIHGRNQGVRLIGFERRVALIIQVIHPEVRIIRILYGGRDIERVLKLL